MFKWLKKKKGVDIIDYTELQKRGLLKKRVEKSSQDIINFTQSQQTQQTQQTQNTEDSSALGFLGSMASSAEPSPTAQPSQQDNPFLNQIKENPEDYPGISSSQMSMIKERIDSFSYKLSRLLDRLEVVEKKIDKHERGI